MNSDTGFFANRYNMMILCLIAVVVGFVAGNQLQSPHAQMQEEQEVSQDEPGVWTCSMHPQVEQPDFGQCPICFMDLILKEAGDDEEEPRKLVISEAARILAELETSPVIVGPATKTLNLVGNIVPDETRSKAVTAWFDGRIDRLFVNYTGMPVTKHDHVAEIYSPELISAHQEIISARNRPDLLRAARQRLLRWGILPEQISEMESADEPFERLTIHTPISGVVVERNVYEGQYVSQGTQMFQIADLSNLWLIISAYESDSYWLRYGQKVDFSVEAFPGETFTGKVTFISPVLDINTRTVPVRVNIDNTDKMLKPGMFARARLKVSLNADGKAMFPDLEGKWISPMHPEIVSDTPGSCDVCGMALVPASSVSTLAGDIEPLLVPETAVLWTGRRSVVYKQVDGQTGSYKGVDVTLGPLVDGYYIVREGLKEGDLVVVNGNFKLDAELQIRARPSMMLPQHEISEPTEECCSLTQAPAVSQAGYEQWSDETLLAYQNLISETLNFSQNLADDKFEAAINNVTKAQESIAEIDLPSDIKHEWMQISNKLSEDFKKIMQHTDIQSVREVLPEITLSLEKLFKHYGQPLDEPVFLMHCPMAFNNQGGDWYQLTDQLANPYFGATMYRCGTQEARLDPK